MTGSVCPGNVNYHQGHFDITLVLAFQEGFTKVFSNLTLVEHVLHHNPDCRVRFCPKDNSPLIASISNKSRGVLHHEWCWDIFHPEMKRIGIWLTAYLCVT